MLTGVSAGALTSASTDAVNGSQLFTANERVAAAFGTTLDGTGQLIAPSYTIQGSVFNNVGGAFNAVDNALTNLTTGINNGSIGLVQQNPGTKVITVGASTDGTVVNMAGTAGDRLLTGVWARVPLGDQHGCGERQPVIRHQPAGRHTGQSGRNQHHRYRNAQLDGGRHLGIRTVCEGQ